MAKKVQLYALSTCAWCKRTKRFFKKNGIEYSFVDVDLLDPEKKQKARAELAKHNPRRTYPTVVIDGKDVVVGFHEQKLKELLGI